MDPGQHTPADAVIGLAMLVALVAIFAVWWQLIMRRLRGLPLVAYSPRRQVPWNGLDVLVVFSITMLAVPLTFLVAPHVADPVRPQPTMLETTDDLDRPSVTEEETADAEVSEEAGPEANREHALLQLLRQDGSVGVILLCLLTGAIVAPLTEEFLFRLVLQGWAEAVERRLRKYLVWLRGMMRGLIPVVLVALFFAGSHFREPGPDQDPDDLIRMMACGSLGGLLALGLSVVYLRLRTRASLADFGIVREEFLKDVGRGLVAFLAVMIPVFGIQAALTFFCPTIVPDPIALFPFALVLGYLYFRTHRIVPAVTLHMALNGTSMTMALMTL